MRDEKRKQSQRKRKATFVANHKEQVLEDHRSYNTSNRAVINQKQALYDKKVAENASALQGYCDIVDCVPGCSDIEQ